MKYIFMLLIAISVTGCSTVATQQIWNDENEEWTNLQQMKCRGPGCKADFKNHTMAGGVFIPPLPNVKVDN